MGFPITYQFAGSAATKLKQVGNAVCPHVTRALARLVKQSLNSPKSEIPVPMVSRPAISGSNLNDFLKTKFKKQKPGIKGARFRTHLFKSNGLTVELSNFDVIGRKKSGRKWRTSVFLGIGEGFEIQAHETTDISLRAIERELRTHLADGEQFIQLINNGFSERIPRNYQTAQLLVERKLTNSHYDSPQLIVKKIGSLIQKFQSRDEIVQSHELPIRKSKLPIKQIMALYAFNKVARVINTGR